MYPVYIPQLCCVAPRLDVLPVIPAIIISLFVLIGEWLLYFVLSAVCCQSIQMFVSDAIGVSPPLRPIVPSELNSPYIDSVPYIGVWPYKSPGVVDGSAAGEVFAGFVECSPNAFNVFCVIACCHAEMLCAVIVFANA